MYQLRHKLILAFSIACMLLIAAGGVLYYSASDYTQHMEAMLKTQDRLTSLRLVMSTLLDAETGQRGYLITGKDSYLEPYDKAVKSIDKNLDDLKEAYEGEYKSRIERIEYHTSIKLQEMYQTIQSRKAYGFAISREIVLNDTGKQNMDELRELIGNMMVLEESRLDNSSTQLSLHNQFVAGTTAILGVIAIVYLLSTLYVLLLEEKKNQKLAVDLHEAATYDGLTQLYNRKAFSTQLSQNLALARRQGSKFGVLYVDVDKFKFINDTYGHDVGDIVLKALARVLNATVRDTDVVGRLGGDEFAIIVPQAEKTADLNVLAERINSAVIATNIPALEGRTLTISVGAAMYPYDGVTEEMLMKRADTNMYFNKNEKKRA